MAFIAEASSLFYTSVVLQSAPQERVLADDGGYDKQLTTQPRDWAYDVEGYDFAAEALGRKLMADALPSTRKVRRLIPSCCTCFTPFAPKFNAKMRSNIDGITPGLQDISLQRKDLCFSKNRTGGMSATMIQILPTTFLVDESRVWDGETDKAAVAHLLLHGHERNGGAVGAIPIIGMGGVGKTVSVCVSDHFDVV